MGGDGQEEWDSGAFDVREKKTAQTQTGGRASQRGRHEATRRSRHWREPS